MIRSWYFPFTLSFLYMIYPFWHIISEPEPEPHWDSEWGISTNTKYYTHSGFVYFDLTYMIMKWFYCRDQGLLIVIGRQQVFLYFIVSSKYCPNPGPRTMTNSSKTPTWLFLCLEMKTHFLKREGVMSFFLKSLDENRFCSFIYVWLLKEKTELTIWKYVLIMASKLCSFLQMVYLHFCAVLTSTKTESCIQFQYCCYNNI